MAEKRKFSLKRAFKKAVLGIAAFVTFAYGSYYQAFYAGRGDRLTTGEAAAVTEIFGGQVNTTSIRKHFKDDDHFTHLFRWAQGTVLPPFSHIDFFGEWVRSPDFSKSDRQHFGFFMHEVTHTWQGQNWRFSSHEVGRYDYDHRLNAQSRFRDFGTEQQAELVEAYAEAFIHPDGAQMPRTPQLMQVQRVVEEQFPQARVTRERLERERAATPAPAKNTKPAPTPPRNS